MNHHLQILSVEMLREVENLVSTMIQIFKRWIR